MSTKHYGLLKAVVQLLSTCCESSFGANDTVVRLWPVVATGGGFLRLKLNLQHRQEANPLSQAELSLVLEDLEVEFNGF